MTDYDLFGCKPVPRTAGEAPGKVRGARVRVGSRVRMSELGRQRHPKYGEREGVVIGRGSPSSWRVKFDQRVTPQAIFDGYLEVIPREKSEANSASPTRPRPGGSS